MAEPTALPQAVVHYETTYRNSQIVVWCDCGKSTPVGTRPIPDTVYASHRCGPVGSAWDSATMFPATAH